MATISPSLNLTSNLSFERYCAHWKTCLFKFTVRQGMRSESFSQKKQTEEKLGAWNDRRVTLAWTSKSLSFQLSFFPFAPFFVLTYLFQIAWYILCVKKLCCLQRHHGSQFQSKTSKWLTWVADEVNLEMNHYLLVNQAIHLSNLQSSCMNHAFRGCPCQNLWKMYTVKNYCHFI